eukprot:Selendium_serpulae@DN11994_c0_g1_i1.p2
MMQLENDGKDDSRRPQSANADAGISISESNGTGTAPPSQQLSTAEGDVGKSDLILSMGVESIPAAVRDGDGAQRGAAASDEAAVSSESDLAVEAVGRAVGQPVGQTVGD